MVGELVGEVYMVGECGVWVLGDGGYQCIVECIVGIGGVQYLYLFGVYLVVWLGVVVQVFFGV